MGAEAAAWISPRRLVAMGVAGAVLALLAWAVGYPRAALGVVAGMPVGMANYGLSLAGWRRGRGAGLLLGVTGLRLLVSLGALLLASRFGAELLLGVLGGLLLEVLTYFRDSVGILLRRRG